MKKFRAFTIVLSLLLAAQANADIITIADSNIGSASNNTFFSNVFGGSDTYGRISGTSWTLTNWTASINAASNSYAQGALSAAALAGVEWLVASTNTAYTAAEIAIVNAFLGGGGNMVVIGEGPNYSTINTNANALLAAVGSGMSFVDGGAASTKPFLAVGSDPLLAGVPQFYGNYTGSVAAGGTALFMSSNQQVIAAVERQAAVPEPGTLALFGIGLFGMGLARRKKA